MAIDIERALMGLGAAVGGTVPQFRQQMMQEDQMARQRATADEEAAEKRKQTLFADASAASSLLSSGDTRGVVDLMQDRLNILSRLPGVDTRHTARYVEMAKAADQGSRQAFETLQFELGNAVKAGRAYNQISGESSAPSSFRSLQLQAQAAGLKEGDADYQEFMRYGGAAGDMGAAKTVTYNNGTVVKITRTGAPEVYGPNGQLVTDETQKENVLIEARKEGIAYEGDVAGARARGTKEQGRKQEFITKGLAAADATAIIRRSLQLLDRVETGGIGPQLGLAVRRMFGVEGADEGELSANLGKAVLAQLRDVFGAAFTEQEGESLKKIEAGFGSDVATNRRLLNNSLAVAERAAARGIRAAEANDDYESASEIEMSLDFDLGAFQDEYASYAEQQKPGIDNDGGQELPVVTTSEEHSAIPSGSLYIDSEDGITYRKK
tara:strand:- start:2829 stop:4142 length:1314 start_codon:yes stop_codon:yes gene_type:complete